MQWLKAMTKPPSQRGNVFVLFSFICLFCCLCLFLPISVSHFLLKAGTKPQTSDQIERLCKGRWSCFYAKGGRVYSLYTDDHGATHTFSCTCLIPCSSFTTTLGLRMSLLTSLPLLPLEEIASNLDFSSLVCLLSDWCIDLFLILIVFVNS